MTSPREELKRGGGVEALRRGEPELREQRLIGFDIRIAGRQQPIAVENRIGAGEKAKRLNGVGEFASAGRKTHHRLRHRDSRGGYRADELERVERAFAVKAIM